MFGEPEHPPFLYLLKTVRKSQRMHAWFSNVCFDTTPLPFGTLTHWPIVLNYKYPALYPYVPDADAGIQPICMRR